MSLLVFYYFICSLSGAVAVFFYFCCPMSLVQGHVTRRNFTLKRPHQ